MPAPEPLNARVQIMNESTRTKLLGGILLSVVAVWMLRPLVDGWLFEPIRKAKQDAKVAQQQLETLEEQEFALAKDKAQLQEWTDASLPADVLIAQRLYQEFITNLAFQCAFQGSDVNPVGKNSKIGKYSTVSVSLKAETNLTGLSRFMYLFDQANLMQRITQLKITSTGTQGDPRLDISLTAEGMSVEGSELRRELFPRTFLEQPLPADGDEVFVTQNDRFPKEQDFLARIGTEIIRVSRVEGDNWLVQRGAEGTQPVAHQVNDVIELMPIAWEKRENMFSRYEPLLAESPFTTPKPPKSWTPRLNGVTDKTVYPGDEVRLKLKADGLNPELGDPVFTLLEAPEGMALDEASGEIIWATPEEAETGEYNAKLQMTQSANADLNLESSFTVTLKARNTPPELTLPEKAIVVIGRDFSVQASAKDAETPDDLKYEFAEGVPTGLAIDAATGVITWNPEMTMTPGDYTVNVKVSDGGEEPLSATSAITLQLQDDSAVLTRLTGSVSKGDASYAWFRNLGTGISSQLKVGDRLVVAEIDAEIVEIQRRSVMVRDNDGVWQLNLGDTVRNRVLVTPAEDSSKGSPADAIETEVPSGTTESGATSTGADTEEPDTSAAQPGGNDTTVPGTGSTDPVTGDAEES
jgi:hypothetical protein